MPSQARSKDALKRQRSSQDDDPPRRRKKARASVRKAGERILREMPLEMIFEVLYYLQPYDLLRLARTSQDFRSLLMSRSSAFLWRQARANADVQTPDLPVNMSEPVYAHLLFHNFCHFCLTTRCEKAIWEYRVRCCRKCFPTRFIPYTREMLEKYYALSQEWHRISLVIPKTTADYFKGTHVYLECVETYNAELFSLEDDANAIAQWFSSKTEVYDNIKTHASACRLWETRWKSHQILERQAARKSRIEWIEEKAIEQGWDFEVWTKRAAGFPSFAIKASRHPSINKKIKSALNHSDWVKIQSLVLEPLQLQRSMLWKQAMDRRLIHLQYAFIETSLPHDMVLPSIGDLITSNGPIKQLLETTPLDRNPLGVDTIFDGPFSLCARTLASPEFLAFVTKWRRDKEGELLNILQEAVSRKCSESDLCLATTVFKCNARGCGKALYYPDVFLHCCATAYSFQPEREVSMSDTSGSTSELVTAEGNTFDCCKMLTVKPWNDGGKRISFYHHASAIFASEIFRLNLNADAPRLDPRTTTIQQIVNECPTICCRSCSWAILSWLDLPEHQIAGHETTIHWATSAVNVVNSSETSSTSGSWVFGSRCTLCWGLFHPNSVGGSSSSSAQRKHVKGALVYRLEQPYPGLIWSSSLLPRPVKLLSLNSLDTDRYF
ncbi:hypothetical protein BT96DRAFT_886430 [Gymnopus androsaceus JB14]|uniref:F-box domain-containing protein n=1 Tax=Gymnopus androsaceus JB14 TaxID=1447944 RepID=A0A6A4H991_9AGAR|nr:hypothetical protein BT96DRAFT_886430 [Gymnopus androsaceus JB14]